MTKEACETRLKILQVASHLFAKNGFDGTSVRDIAGQAEVNIASINYHFKNKQSLYWEIYQLARQRLTEDMTKIASEDVDLVDFCLATFDVMLANSDMVRNTFKLILSDSIPEPEEDSQLFCSQPQVGPPGGEILLSVIQRELGSDICQAAQSWGVRVLFSLIAHWALMHGTSYLNKACKTNPELKPEMTRHLIRLHVQSTAEYLKAHGSDKALFMGPLKV